MIFVGIDVAKDTHYAAVSDDSGAVLVKPFAFQNNAEGFCLLLKKLSEFDRSKLLIGLESTGIYSENLICFLYESGFRLAVINPIQTATLRKTAIRKTKTDKVDTMLIIKSLMVNSYRLYSQRDADSLKLRTLCRFRQNLKKSKARLKIQLAGYVNLVFPEFGKFFKSGIHIAASYALLKKYSSPKEIAALRTSTLCTLLSKASHGRFGKDTAEALKSLALSSVGVKNPYISIQIAQTIAQIELLEQQIKDLNSAIEEAMESLNSVLMTIPVSVRSMPPAFLVKSVILSASQSPASFSPMPVLTRLFANPGSLPLNLPVCPSVVLPCFDMHLSILPGSSPLTTLLSKPTTTLNALRGLTITALLVMSLISSPELFLSS